MRSTSILASALAFLALASAQLGRPQTADEAIGATEGAAGGKFEGNLKTKTTGGSDETTTFNGKEVPALKKITGDTFDDTVKTGTWLVEFFSPYCHHCKKFAPAYQTLHEFYYTSDVPAGSAKDFEAFYDFHLAKVDCVASGDLCNDQHIQAYPSFKLFKNGVTNDTEIQVGAKSMEDMSGFIEGVLEELKPGSRPEGGPELPKVGDRSVGKQAAVPAVPPTEAVVPEATPVVPEVKPVVLPTKPAMKQPSTYPNQLGKSVLLTAETFQQLVTTTQDPWFIKFFVPWCSHCQELAPKWKEMARHKKGELNIGEVNCDVDKRLCKDVKVLGYPAMIFFLGGERIEYHGLRGLGDLIDYGSQAVAVANGVRDVTIAEFEELEKKEEVLFLYVYDVATTSEDFRALERLQMSMIGHAKLVKSSDPALATRFKVSTWPTILVSRDGVPAYYDGLAPSDMRDVRRVLDWMRKVWLPIVPELTAANALDIMRDKIVVLGILNRENTEEFEFAKREIKNAALEWIGKQEQQFQLELQELRDAKQLRIDEAEDRDDQRGLRAAKSIRINREDLQKKQVTFAWVDGVFWERWIKTTYGISIRDGDRVIINDEANRGYWDNTITGNPIVPSRTSILETLPKVVASPPKIRAKTTHTTMDHFWWTIKRGIVRHPILNGSFLLIATLIVAFYARKVYKAWNGGSISLSEKSDPLGGLLNGGMSQGGKHD